MLATFLQNCRILQLTDYFQKGKSDNKFYAAMREKEAIDNERKLLTKTVEKQGKVIDRFNEIEKQLKSQIVCYSAIPHRSELKENQGVLEKESLVQRKYIETLKDRLLRLDKENPELRLQLDEEKKRVHEVRFLSTFNSIRFAYSQFR